MVHSIPDTTQDCITQLGLVHFSCSAVKSPQKREVLEIWRAARRQDVAPGKMMSGLFIYLFRDILTNFWFKGVGVIQLPQLSPILCDLTTNQLSAQQSASESPRTQWDTIYHRKHLQTHLTDMKTSLPRWGQYCGLFSRLLLSVSEWYVALLCGLRCWRPRSEDYLHQFPR